MSNFFGVFRLFFEVKYLETPEDLFSLFSLHSEHSNVIKTRIFLVFAILRLKKFNSILTLNFLFRAFKNDTINFHCLLNDKKIFFYH